MWQALEKFKGDSSVKTYVLRVAHNRAITLVSYHAKQPRNENYCEVKTPQPSQQVSSDVQFPNSSRFKPFLNKLEKNKFKVT